MTGRMYAVVRRGGLYPITTGYIGAVVAVIGTAAGWWEPLAAILVLAAGFAVLLMLSVLDTIHVLVNSQHDDLIARVDQLTASLNESGTAVPADPRRQP